MLVLAARRLASMILIMFVISVLLFVFFEGDKLNLAMRVLGQYSTMEGRLQWLEDNGYNRSLLTRYFSWLYPIARRLTPAYVSTLRELAQAMLAAVANGYPRRVLEVRDMVALAAGKASPKL